MADEINDDDMIIIQEVIKDANKKDDVTTDTDKKDDVIDARDITENAKTTMQDIINETIKKDNIEEKHLPHEISSKTRFMDASFTEYRKTTPFALNPMDERFQTKSKKSCAQSISNTVSYEHVHDIFPELFQDDEEPVNPEIIMVRRPIKELYPEILEKACLNGDYQMFQTLINNTTLTEDYTAKLLYLACQGQNPRIVKDILSKDVDISYDIVKTAQAIYMMSDKKNNKIASAILIMLLNAYKKRSS